LKKKRKKRIGIEPMKSLKNRKDVALRIFGKIGRVVSGIVGILCILLGIATGLVIVVMFWFGVLLCLTMIFAIVGIALMIFAILLGFLMVFYLWLALIVLTLVVVYYAISLTGEYGPSAQK
jgi:hypothetical protein